METLEAENRWLKEQFLLARRKQFGTSSERTMADATQCEMLFNEAEATADTVSEEALVEKITYTRKRKTVGHRQEMLADLPMETREYRLAEDEQICCCCGGQMHEMSTETRNELDIIPAQVKVIRHVRYVYSCRHCERNEIETPIVRASAPAPLIEKSLASASALSYIMGMKFVEAMPLYRQEKHFERMGVELPRALLSNWTLLGGEMLMPIYSRMKEKLIRLPILHADETTLSVLKEEGRRAQSKSYVWLYRSGRDGPPIVLFEYQRTREGEHPRRFLTGFAGHLHVDGYAGYQGMSGVRLVGCWGHARRKFVEARAILPKDRQNEAGHLVNVGLGYINRLFEIEREMHDVSSDERKAGRGQKSKPVVEEFKVWVDTQSLRVLPKSLLGQAIAYCQSQWAKLIVFLEDGRLELDNNRSERSIKPFVIGRKNWLFANTPRGAKTSAVIYSIVETAKENGLNPSEYLRYVFERLPEIPAQNTDAIDLLLPWSETVQEALKPGHTSAT
jgi:transposase